jgi:hypothetical protein
LPLQNQQYTTNNTTNFDCCGNISDYNCLYNCATNPLYLTFGVESNTSSWYKETTDQWQSVTDSYHIGYSYDTHSLLSNPCLQVTNLYRLSSNSPCINAGTNLWTSSDRDRDGNPRLSGGTNDMGCYEYQQGSN